MRRWLLALALVPAFGWAEPKSVYIRDLTWVEVREAIEEGKTTVLYYAGSTEQNGPHMALGKHNIIANYLAGRVARKLGNALVAPTMAMVSAWLMLADNARTAARASLFMASSRAFLFGPRRRSP